jgi:uncharacterized Tic20 family protein
LSLDAPVLASDRHWAMAAHVSAFVLALMTSWMAGLAGALAAFVVWLLVRGNTSPFATRHALEAMNFNLSMTCYAVALGLVVIFTLGLGLLVALPAWAVLAVVWFVCSIQATLAASAGRAYHYPLSLGFFR